MLVVACKQQRCGQPARTTHYDWGVGLEGGEQSVPYYACPLRERVVTAARNVSAPVLCMVSLAELA